MTRVNLGDARVVVISSAVKPDNPELCRRAKRLIPVVRRAEMLAELMRLKCVDRRRRHARQDHDHVADRARAGCRRTRPDRRQRRHHQRLGHQRPAWRWRLDGRGGRRERRHVREAAGDDRRRHQHRSGAPGSLRHLRGADAKRSTLRRATSRSTASRCCASIIRRCRLCRRGCSTGASSPTASARRPMCAPSTSRQWPRACAFDVGHPIAKTGKRRAGSSAVQLPMPGQHNVAERAGGASPSPRELGIDDDVVRQALAGLRRREAALHPHRQADGVAVDRRLRPPSGGDRGGAAAARAVTPGPGDRGSAAAPLHAASPDLFEEFCTCFNDADTVIVRRRLCRRRSADRRRRPRRAGRGPAPARPPSSVPPVDGPDDSGRHGRADRHAGRLRGLPRRRQHHAVGERVAGELAHASRAGAADDAGPQATGWLRGGCRRARQAALRMFRSRRFTWFRVGGPAEVMFRPATPMTSRLPAALPADVPVRRMGVGLQHAGPRRRRSGRGCSPGRRFRRRGRKDGDTRRSPAPARSTSTSRWARSRRGWVGWSSFPACPARSAAR